MWRKVDCGNDDDDGPFSPIWQFVNFFLLLLKAQSKQTVSGWIGIREKKCGVEG
jgi:hypothetical protein